MNVRRFGDSIETYETCRSKYERCIEICKKSIENVYRDEDDEPGANGNK
jgi:hypothetical protein